MQAGGRRTSGHAIVQWSPHDNNKFAVARDDLRLYQVVSGSNNADERSTINAGLFVPKRRSFRLVDVVVNTELPRLKCFDWFPGASDPLLVGVGLGSGNLVRARSAFAGHEYALPLE